VPVLSRDEHLLFFNTNRPGGSGDVDVWVAQRAKRTDDFAWGPPVNLGAAVSSAFFDGAPGLLEKGGRTRLYFASGRPPGARDRLDIYVSEQGADGSFGEPAFVDELNTPFNEARLSVRKDGREAFFFSNRPGSAGLDLWTSTRPKAFDPWSPPTNLGPEINTAFAEIQPHIAPDRLTLLFASDRPGGLGRADLYLSTRTESGDG
jgi:peptidoglycan-associated lipoprotein